MNRAEREEIARHVAELDALSGPTPDDDTTAEAQTLIVLTKMMLVLPAAKQNEASAEARGEAYMMALNDLPTWAVAAAVRRWYRGDAGDRHDYHWAPSPAELRALTIIELYRVKGRTAMLRNLLRAELLIEYSEEHCAMMRARLATVIPRAAGM